MSESRCSEKEFIIEAIVLVNVKIFNVLNKLSLISEAAVAQPG
ncbi:MAG: hypothetical protein QW073_05065 [Desulfurococcaceae archaeon]